ncbi:rho GTPase-activating protein 27 [Paroedura picta]|uniref:rho GTPase-activating protein 27 n=1 Tax=Paroedura picta TaxID=143630 RepID=UPI004057091A
MEALGGEEEAYILVEYAFEYTAKDGHLVSIKPNERYVLLKQTNDHWWHVRKSKGSRPFYIPAKYVRQLTPVAQTEPPAGSLPPTTLLGNADLRAPIGVGRQQAPEYEYRFVSAVQEREPQKTDTDEPSDSSQTPFVPLRAGLEYPHGVHNKILPPPPSREKRAIPASLSAFHCSLKPPCPADSSRSSRVSHNRSAEHIRPTVSLDDLARLTSHSQEGTGDSGLYKAASWGHPHPLLKIGSENVYKPAAGRAKQATEVCEAQPHTESAPDPVYVNLQELQKERSTAAASRTDCTLQLGRGSPLLNWERYTDTESGHVFYYNPVTGQTTWDCPLDGFAEGGSPAHSRSSSVTFSPTTPAEWDQYVDQASGQVFFYNSATGETSWDAPQAGDALSYPEVQPAFTPFSPMDRRPPTPETDYPELSPNDLDHYPEEDYSPLGSRRTPTFSYPPSSYHSWDSNSHPQDVQLVDSDTVPAPSHHRSTSSGSSVDSSPFGTWSTSQSAFSPPKEEAQFQTFEKVGMLHRTKTAEKGKRLRKNWSSSWTVLKGGILTFFKDSKHSASGGVKHPSVLSSPEYTVDLRGATLSWASKEKSSKKHVLELKTQEGSEYLIQHDSESIISTWQKAIADTISRLVRGLPFPPEDHGESSADLGLKEPAGSSRDKEAGKKSPAGTWHSSSSLNTDSETSKVRNKLRKFLLRRPTLQSLREKGYIKDQVFGCPLQTLCDREKSTVPQFVRMCICTVEKRGLDIDGLYRVSGNLATIQKLRYKVDHNECFDLEEGRWDDVHVITGALKLFFRELPEPLFPFSHFDKFIAAIKMPESPKRSLQLRELVQSLPAANRDTMKALFQHLCRVIDCRKENRMSAHSLAIIFGPTLLKPEAEEGNMTMHMVFQNQVVEQILSQFSYIFPES